MDENFVVVLFKNKIKKKIINKFKTFKRAENFYQNLQKKTNHIIFEKKWENAKPCKYELAILEKNKNTGPIFSIDDLGRNIRVTLDDDQYSINKINTFKKEEKIYDLSLNKKITIDFFIEKYLSGNTTKLVSSLNNKIVVQSDENFSLFSLKNSDDSHRLIDKLTSHFINIGKGGVIFVKDVDPSQRSYIYKILSEKGFDKKMLYRLTTTHSTRLKEK
jgi:hypothetical protein